VPLAPADAHHLPSGEEPSARNAQGGRFATNTVAAPCGDPEGQSSSHNVFPSVAAIVLPSAQTPNARN